MSNLQLRASAFQRRFTIGTAIMLLGLVLAAVSCAVTGQARPLLPVLPSPTAVDSLIEGEVIEVEFQELNEDPAAFLGRYIRVTGTLTPIEPEACHDDNGHYTGPLIQWALVNDNLQMDARGFEQVISLVRPGTTMTVEGIWRLYQGPLGCGKQPEQGMTWYLETIRIVEPNLLFIPAAPGTVLTETPLVPGVPEATGTAGGTLPPTSALTPGTTATPTVTAGTPGGRTGTPTRTPLPTPTLLPTPPTAQGTAAPAPTGQGTRTATPSGTTTGTPPATFTAEPPGPSTGTPDGYPGGPTPTPSPTPDPYA
jgi:hypothetical protein